MSLVELCHVWNVHGVRGDRHGVLRLWNDRHARSYGVNCRLHDHPRGRWRRLKPGVEGRRSASGRLTRGLPRLCLRGPRVNGPLRRRRGGGMCHGTYFKTNKTTVCSTSGALTYLRLFNVLRYAAKRSFDDAIVNVEMLKVCGMNVISHGVRVILGHLGISTLAWIVRSMPATSTFVKSIKKHLGVCHD